MENIRAVLMAPYMRKTYSLLRQNEDGTQEIDMEVLREVIWKAQEQGASVWILSNRAKTLADIDLEGPHEK